MKLIVFSFQELLLEEFSQPPLFLQLLPILPENSTWKGPEPEDMNHSKEMFCQEKNSISNLELQS